MKKVLILSFLINFCFLFSQSKSFIYQLKFKPNSTKDSIAKEIFILDVKEGRSVFRTLKEKTADSTSQVSNRISFFTTSFKDFKSVSKDLKTKKIKKFITNFQKLFTIKIEDELIWEIANETKEIAGMKTQKATTNYGGRNWIAWFTNEIPLQEVPYIFHGLPGLITEISDVQNNFSFSLVQIRNSDGKLYEKENSLAISWKQYQKLAKDYYADPTREINGKNSGSPVLMKWVDEQGNEVNPNFKEMNEKEQKEIRLNNNPIELNHIIAY